MMNVSPVLSPQSALGMVHWQEQARGYFGQYLYGIPRQIRMRFLGSDGRPLAGATVRVYQKCDRPGIGEVTSTQVKFTGRTGADGAYAVPNVPIDETIARPSLVGDTLRANPFGYVNVLGTNGSMLFELEVGRQRAYAWLDLAEVNTAYYRGDRDAATFERTVERRVGENQPPDCSAAVASPRTLWPPNRRMVRVKIAGVRGPDGDPVTIRILGVASSDEVGSRGGGGTCPDARVRGDHAWLRAERSASGPGRTYVVRFEATDGAGASCQGSVTVCVPHGRRRGHVSCRPEPAQYDALRCGDERAGPAALAAGTPGPDTDKELPASDEPAPLLAIRRVSPNPSAGPLLVSIVLPAPDEGRLDMVDVTGRRVMSREVGSLGPGEHVVTLGQTGLPPGLYLIRLTTSQGTRTARAIVIR